MKVGDTAYIVESNRFVREVEMRNHKEKPEEAGERKEAGV